VSLDLALARITLQLSALAYASPDRMGPELADLGLRDLTFASGWSTQAFTARSDDVHYIAFRGSEQVADWLTNARFLPTSREQGVHIHSGFITALDEVWGELASALRTDPLPVVVTGHSLGGALASLAALRLAITGHAVAGVVTFGQPRTGHADFRRLYDSLLAGVTLRFVNHIDLVTRVPLLAQNYRHVGRRMYFDEVGELHEDASAWQIARDDLRYRFRHLGSISSIGIAPHLLPEYRSKLNRLG
jgi:triacylglycerol lipase